ncbi:hypothetical protein [Fructobacillus sp. EFB-N1]|uniref:hypothetical protein n=1 Tax=Fructobacillus sp. EFB-N1 TaxID=1658766 RepID=UPI00064DD13E|nr:hypothetical protein [Fructobacillus sp. EFB-N1]
MIDDVLAALKAGENDVDNVKNGYKGQSDTAMSTAKTNQLLPWVSLKRTLRLRLLPCHDCQMMLSRLLTKSLINKSQLLPPTLIIQPIRNK